MMPTSNGDAESVERIRMCCCDVIEDVFALTMIEQRF
jgi:hypothetical protein